MGSVSGGRVAVLVCLLSRRRRGFLGLVWSRGLPDLLDQHLQRADHRDGQQRRDETAEYMPPIRLPIEGADQHRDEYEQRVDPRTVPLRDVQEAASHADPRTTIRYDRARGSLDRHATYIVAAYVAGAAR